MEVSGRITVPEAKGLFKRAEEVSCGAGKQCAFGFERLRMSKKINLLIKSHLGEAGVKA